MADAAASGDSGGGMDSAGWLAATAALASSVGGFLGGKNQGLASHDQRFIAHQQMAMAERNEAFQRQLATQGIRMRVADAEAAGLHPLAALGASGASGGFGPASISGGSDYQPSRVGHGLQNMGQEISRAMMAGATREEREYKKLQLQNMRTQNEMQNLDLIQRRNSMGLNNPPGSATDGLGSSLMPGQDNRVTLVPKKITRSGRYDKSIEAGSVRGSTFYFTPGGGLAPVISNDLSEPLEDDIIGKTMWNARYYGSHPFRGANVPPTSREYPLPSGYSHWKWIPWLAEWRPVKKSKSFMKSHIAGYDYYDSRNSGRNR